MNPAAAAAHARGEGIVVNVIGVVDRGEIGELGAVEIADIANAGGGISRIVSTSQLSQTVQMMTRKTVMHTIQQAVNKELRAIMGDGSLEALHPDKRAQVVQTIDELSEKSALRVTLLIDASASMKPKLAAVEDAIRDLMLSLQARSGVSEISVFHFPGNTSGESAVMDLSWTSDLAKVRQLFYKINMKGTTPTGPALMQVVRYMTAEGQAAQASGFGEALYDHSSNGAPENRDGMLRDYVV
jgi:Ca-activated chloride channel family protein